MGAANVGATAQGLDREAGLVGGLQQIQEASRLGKRSNLLALLNLLEVRRKTIHHSTTFTSPSHQWGRCRPSPFSDTVIVRTPGAASGATRPFRITFPS